MLESRQGKAKDDLWEVAKGQIGEVDDSLDHYSRHFPGTELIEFLLLPLGEIIVHEVVLSPIASGLSDRPGQRPAWMLCDYFLEIVIAGPAHRYRGRAVLRKLVILPQCERCVVGRLLIHRPCPQYGWHRVWVVI